jgi:hypothetical protein
MPGKYHEGSTQRLDLFTTPESPFSLIFGKQIASQVLQSDYTASKYQVGPVWTDEWTAFGGRPEWAARRAGWGSVEALVGRRSPGGRDEEHLTRVDQRRVLQVIELGDSLG